MNPFAVAAIVLGGVIGAAYAVAVVERALAARRLEPALVVAPLVEAGREVRRQSLAPSGADGLLFRTAPFIALVAIMQAALFIPIGDGLSGIDTSIGLFYFIVVLSPFVMAMMNAGWSQNSKEGLFGAFRAAPHLISYEVPLGFAAIGPAMAAETLSTAGIVEAQASLWYGAWQPLGVAIFLVSALFVTFRHPFDIPQSGSELEGGVLSEMTGARLVIFRWALDAIFALLMAMAVVLFLGGWHGPLLPGPFWFALKAVALGAAVLAATRMLPRLRHEQMLRLAWLVLVPASLVNVGIVGVFILWVPGT